MPAVKSKSNLATAFFHAAYGATGIEKENGILRGVKIMEVGHVANFKGEDGKSKSVKITPAHIDALLAHAGNRALPIHETHEWFDAEGEANADSVERSARIGSLKSFRRDASGHLIADAVLNLEKQPARDLLFGAEHNPEDNCFSAVFSYRKDDPQCMPINFRAADVVPSGAATTALFSADDSTQNTPSMDISELIAALDDPKVKDALKAILKSHKGPEDIAAEMEADAGVKPEDKKPEDDQKPALMRATARCSRAFKRQLAEVSAEIGIKSEAAATALLGKGGKFQVSGGEWKTELPFTALLAKHKSTGASNGVAILRAKNDAPGNDYNAWEAAGRPMPA